MRNWINVVDASGIVNFPEYPAIVADHVRAFIRALEDKGYVGMMGGKRIAMISPDRKTVIKVPICDRGMFDNNREQNHFNRQKKGKEWIQIAACREFYADKEIGVPMLMMRYVEPIDPREPGLPEWVDCVDCQQVGRDHRGNVVAYDL